MFLSLYPCHVISQLQHYRPTAPVSLRHDSRQSGLRALMSACSTTLSLRGVNVFAVFRQIVNCCRCMGWLRSDNRLSRCQWLTVSLIVNWEQILVLTSALHNNPLAHTLTRLAEVEILWTVCLQCTVFADNELYCTSYVVGLHEQTAYNRMNTGALYSPGMYHVHETLSYKT